MMASLGPELCQEVKDMGEKQNVMQSILRLVHF